MISLADRDKFPSVPGCYILHFPNGKQYVGVTQNSIRTRLLHHLNAAIAGRINVPVRAAIAKYGCENIHIEFEADCQNPLKREMEMIAGLRARGVVLYNLTDGGEGISGFSHDPIVRARMSRAAKRSWTPQRRANALAKMADPDFRKKLSDGQKRSWSEERRSNMAKRVRARSAKLSEETVLEIAKLLSSGASCASLGRMFGVTPEAISAIKHGKNWSHVTGINRAA